ncbi:MAG TPA: hypothetical protein GX404_05095 [Syntrophomonadaceae bacterium]|nr:hypothetical protein [Syntrophomonadaceae bacterium]
MLSSNIAFDEEVVLKNIIDLTRVEGYNLETPNHQIKIIVEWVDLNNKKNTKEIEIMKD